MFNFFELLITSLFAGAIGAMTGIGGGLILIPVLTLMGVPIKYAIASSLLSVIATSSGSASAYVRDRLSNIRIGMYLEMFTVVGAIVGATITVFIPQDDVWTLYIAFAAILLISFYLLLVKKSGEILPFTPVQDKISKILKIHGVYYDKAMNKWIYYKAKRAPAGGSAMFGAGLIAGLLGIGAGAVKVLIHDLIMNMPSKVSTTTSNFIIGVTALAGTSIYVAAGFISFYIVVPVMIGVTIGAALGTKVFVKMHNLQVRKMFLIILLAMGIEMVVRGIIVMPH